MKIICGLGNPGAQYERTRHNIGFLYLDHIVSRYMFSPFTGDPAFHAQISTGFMPHRAEKLVLVKPDTFMNRSGHAVHAIMHYFKASLSDLIIVHDDLDIICGKYKIAHNTRAAGHNGVQHIIDTLGTQDFMRIRIGIEAVDGKKSREQISGEAYVLQRFTDAEWEIYTHIFEEITKHVIDPFKI